MATQYIRPVVYQGNGSVWISEQEGTVIVFVDTTLGPLTVYLPDSSHEVRVVLAKCSDDANLVTVSRSRSTDDIEDADVLVTFATSYGGMDFYGDEDGETWRIRKPAMQLGWS